MTLENSLDINEKSIHVNNPDAVVDRGYTLRKGFFVVLSCPIQNRLVYVESISNKCNGVYTVPA